MYPPLLYQAQMGEIPVAIHFNGHTDKGLLDEWWGKWWWNKSPDQDSRFRGIVLSRLEGAEIQFAGGGKTSWGDVCPKDLLDI
jgi:hypothetical protein